MLRVEHDDRRAARAAGHVHLDDFAAVNTAHAVRILRAEILFAHERQFFQIFQAFERRGIHARLFIAIGKIRVVRLRVADDVAKAFILNGFKLTSGQRFIDMIVKRTFTN